MIFRNGTPSDAKAISELVRALAPAFLVNADGSGAEQFWASVAEATQAARLATPNHHVIVVEDKGSIVAMIGLRDLSHVFHLFVAATHQGQGLSRQLWTRARAYAYEQGHRGDFTVNASLPAVPVYQRFGFQPVGEATCSHGVEILPMKLLAS
jgi:predicted GNAT family N-acyltransferase